MYTKAGQVVGKDARASTFAGGTMTIIARTRVLASAALLMFRALRMFFRDLLANPRLRTALFGAITAWLGTKALRAGINANWSRSELDETRPVRDDHASEQVVLGSDSEPDVASEDDCELRGDLAAKATAGKNSLREHPSESVLIRRHSLTGNLQPGDVRASLLECEALAGLDETTLSFILERAKLLKFLPNETIFEQGGIRDAFLVVLSGQVVIEADSPGVGRDVGSIGKRKEGYTLGPGNTVVSLLCVLASIDTNNGTGDSLPSCRVHNSMAKAGASGSELVALPVSALDDAFTEHPEAMRGLVQLLMARLSTVVLETLSVYFGLHRDFLVQPQVPAIRGTSVADIAKMTPEEAFSHALGDPSQREGWASSVVFASATFLDCQKGECPIPLHSTVPHVLLLLEGDLSAEFLAPAGMQPPGLMSGGGQGQLPSSTPLQFSPGIMIGEMPVFLDKPLVSIVYRCKSRCRFAALPREALHQLLDLQPRVVSLRILQSMTDKMAGWIHRVDAALDWIRIEGGRSLYHKGDPQKGFFVVLSGRLLVLEDEAGSDKARWRVTGSLERGRLCGDLDCLRGSPAYSRTVRARRDTEVCRVSPELLHLLAMDFPHAVLHFSSRLAAEDKKNTDHAQRLATIAIVPADKSVDAREICVQLTDALSVLGKTIHVHAGSDFWPQHMLGEKGKILSPNGGSRTRKARLGRLLAELEEHFQWLVYEAEAEISDWTMRCIRQADVILVAAHFDSSSRGSVSLTPVEQYIESVASHSFGVERHLLLLHQTEHEHKQTAVAPLRAASFALPGIKRVHSLGSVFAERIPFEPMQSTADQRRPGFRGLVAHLGAGLFRGDRRRLRATRHYLVQRPWAKRWFHVRVTEVRDWRRCARLLVGKGVGLCLGGGGARGNIHFGVIRAMEELGIPIDAVSGTSFGALAGGIYAMTAPEPGSLMRLVERVMGTTFSKRKMFMDLTFPRTAYFTGQFLNRVLQDTFARRTCEDMLVPFACTSTDILNFEAKSHREGQLWRIIRASMSLVGFVPPLPHMEKCADEGKFKVCSSLLVDGGYTNQYPTDELRQFGANVVVCVQACPDFEPVSTDYGDRVFGGAVAFLRLLGLRWRWYKGPDPPPQSEIQERLMFLPDATLGGPCRGSDLVLRPPIEGYGLLEFGSYRELELIGYNAAKPRLEDWLKSESGAAQHVCKLLQQAPSEESESGVGLGWSQQKVRLASKATDSPWNVMRKAESAPVGGLLAKLALSSGQR